MKALLASFTINPTSGLSIKDVRSRGVADVRTFRCRKLQIF